MGLDLTTDTADERSAHLIELELYEELVEFAEAPDSERIKVLARQMEHSEFELESPANEELNPEPEILQVLNEATLAPTANETSAELEGDSFLDLDAGPLDPVPGHKVVQETAEGRRPAALPVSDLDSSYLKRPPSVPAESNGKDHSMSWLGEPAIPVPPSTLAEEAAALGLNSRGGEGLRKPNTTGSLLTQEAAPPVNSGDSAAAPPVANLADSAHEPKLPESKPSPARMNGNQQAGSGPAQVERAASPKAEAPKQPKPQIPSSKCSECGRPYNVDDLICISCGSFVG